MLHNIINNRSYNQNIILLLYILTLSLQYLVHSQSSPLQFLKALQLKTNLDFIHINIKNLLQIEHTETRNNKINSVSSNTDKCMQEYTV